MADGDKLRGLLRIYHSSYKELVEGHFSHEVIAETVCKALREQVRRYGDASIGFLDLVADGFSRLPSEPLLVGTIDVMGELRKIDILRQQFYGSTRGLDIALDTCRAYLFDLHDGKISGPHFKNLVASYIDRAYIADFEGNLPLVNKNQKHFPNLDETFVMEQSRNIRPFVDEYINRFADRVSIKKSVDKIRVSSKRKERNISLASGIFSIYR